MAVDVLQLYSGSQDGRIEDEGTLALRSEGRCQVGRGAASRGR